ncbi:MAG: amidohydrolase [Candidatus Limnocylindria bacterium]
MTADLVVRGQVVLEAHAEGLETAEAIAIAAGRVVVAGSTEDVLAAAGPGARVVDVRDRAVVPGLHDFHIHLVGLARARRDISLDGAADVREVAARVREAATRALPDAWLTGRGWSEAQLAGVPLAELEEATGGRPAFLMSHDGHSGWASRAARARAGLQASTPDPAGGRIERDAAGEPTGILRESALSIVQPIVARLQGRTLRAPLDETLRELAGLGLTGVTDAGDYTDENGIGPDADLGDSHSSLTDLGGLVDGRLRLTLDIPVDALGKAAGRGLRTGVALDGWRTMRFGWAKEYSDGALGSGTAALFEPNTCGEPSAGILRVGPDVLDAHFKAARPAGIGMAIHAIGDRAVSVVLDAFERAGRPQAGAPNDRMEHVQLARAVDRARFARLGVSASVQPIHAAADRDLVEACWGGRQADAYAFRSLLEAGALLAAGSDAPIESANPWLGIFAAVHRRFPTDRREDWRPAEALTVSQALRAYTLAPAHAIGVGDEGHLRAGARADLAVLSVDLATLLRGDEALASVRSELTLVDGLEVDRE